jgi:transcription elongation factor Elf1
MIFTNDESIKNALHRMETHESPTLMFYNHDKSFRILLRMDVEEKTLELGICSFSNEIEIPRIMQEIGFPSGYYDNDYQCFFLNEYTDIPYDPDSIKYLRIQLNALYKATVCPCGERLVYDTDSHTHCCFCQMVSSSTTTQSDEEHMCCICHSASGHNLKHMECCNVPIHHQCLSTWYHSKGGKNVSCPICRIKIKALENIS